MLPATRALILLLALASPAVAQPAPVDPGRDWRAAVEPGPMALLVPGVRELGPPDWVRPGLRITFYGASASVAESSYQLVEDPAGTWVDPQTGKRYRKTDDDPRPGDDAGASGDGYSQFDVLSVGRNAVAVNSTLYTVNRLDGTLLVRVLGGGVLHGACPADLWVHPAALRMIATTQREGFTVLRGPVPYQGRTVDALCVVSRTPQGHASCTYDLESGLLLRLSTSSRGASAPVHVPGSPPPAGRTMLTHTTLVGVRQCGLHAGGPLPDWVRAPLTLRYAGVCRSVNPLDPSGLSVEWPASFEVGVEGTGPNWAIVRNRTTVRMPVPQADEVVTAEGAFGPLWIEPRLLAMFVAGSVLDEDPVTKARTSVAAAGGGVATVLTQGPGFAFANTYDSATGRLVELAVSLPSTGLSYRLALETSGPVPPR